MNPDELANAVETVFRQPKPPREALPPVAGSEATPYYQCKRSLRCRKCNGYWPDKCRCEKPQNSQPPGPGPVRRGF